MTVLRILVSTAAFASDVFEWALFDAAGKRIDQGRGAQSTWPRAAQIEAVVAAAQVRLVALQLPPLTGTRLVSAAQYALEDRLAGPIEDQAIALGHQGAAGNVLAV